MHEIHVEKNLYRILQGRLRFARGDLVLFIHEPDSGVIYDSYEIYDQAYKAAYKEGIYTKQEIPEILLKNDLWTPLDDKEADKIQEQIDGKKLEAYQNYLKSKELMRIKREIARLQKNITFIKAKKVSYIRFLAKA